MEKRTVSRDEIMKIASLARLELSSEEIDRYGVQINEILEHFGSIDELDLEKVDPMTHAVTVRNVWRKDEARPSVPREEILSVAPESDGESFVVPGVLKGE
jgi:aspartyl-tRNA(Asn)/glutamyl-tRNA(Gln) amidotransferase subunit C